MNKISQSPFGASNESEIDGLSSIEMKNDLVLSARALLSAHNTRTGSDGSLDSNCIAESSSVISSFSMIPNGSLPVLNTSYPKRRVSKQFAVKKQREVIMSYKINCVSDISAILCTVEVDLKVLLMKGTAEADCCLFFLWLLLNLKSTRSCQVFFHWCDDALKGRKNGTTIIASDEKGKLEDVSTQHHSIIPLEYVFRC